jgi:hypothetical protein
MFFPETAKSGENRFQTSIDAHNQLAEAASSRAAALGGLERTRAAAREDDNGGWSRTAGPSAWAAVRESPAAVGEAVWPISRLQPQATDARCVGATNRAGVGVGGGGGGRAPAAGASRRYRLQSRRSTRASSHDHLRWPPPPVWFIWLPSCGLDAVP